MFLTLYSKAVTQKIKAIFPNTFYSLPEQLLEKAAIQTTPSNLPILPVLGVYRSSWEIIQDQSYVQSFQGVAGLRSPSNTNGNFLKLKRQGIKIIFQFDIVSNTQREMDTVAEELYWFLISYPKVSFQIKNPFPFTFNESNLIFQNVTDNSSPNEFKQSGYLYRTTYDFSLEGCYLINWANWEEIRQIDVGLELITSD